MGFDIAALKAKRVELDIPLFGETLKVYYNPLVVGQDDFQSNYWRARGKLVDENQKQLRDQDSRFETVADVLENNWKFWIPLFCSMVMDWDMVDNGKPVPIDPKIFRSSKERKKDSKGKVTTVVVPAVVPPDLAETIVEAVWQDYQNLGNRNS